MQISKQKRNIDGPTFHMPKPEDIEDRVSSDPFCVGRDVSAFLHTLHMNTDLWDLEYPKEFESPYALSDPADRKRAIVDPLIKIEKKAGFKPNVELNQKRIRLNLLPQIFPDLKTILHAFEEQGADVCILFDYRYQDDDDDGDDEDLKHIFPTKSWELNDAVKHPEGDWKDKLIAFLESVSSTPFRHIRSKQNANTVTATWHKDSSQAVSLRDQKGCNPKNYVSSSDDSRDDES
jgi:hypothetical protein